MSTPFAESIALDTNIYIHAVRANPDFTACHALLYEHLDQLRIFVPLQVFLEVGRNLSQAEMDETFRALSQTEKLTREYQHPTPERIRYWESCGAKKGDAVIAASLEAAEVKYLISENRHFLSQIEALPFEVLSAQQLLDALTSP
jgi:predicted nucleic acid-binding protein